MSLFLINLDSGLLVSLLLIVKIMGKIEFKCQPLLSKIGLTMNSSHNIWFHKIVRFFRSKASKVEDLEGDSNL